MGCVDGGEKVGGFGLSSALQAEAASVRIQAAIRGRSCRRQKAQQVMRVTQLQALIRGNIVRRKTDYHHQQRQRQNLHKQEIEDTNRTYTYQIGASSAIRTSKFVRMEGWIMKANRSKSGWRKRWLVLDGKTLTYSSRQPQQLTA